jgi:monoamine oxidase
MARTPLLFTLRKILRNAVAQQRADRETPEPPVQGNGITRRKFVAMSAAAVSGMAAGALPKLGYALASRRILIVGGGLSGLTAASRLLRAGVAADICEASPRLGGRVSTRFDFNSDGQFCELGGELVDTGHQEIFDLCQEFKIEMQNITDSEIGQDLYFFGYQFLTRSTLLNPEENIGDFYDMAERIAEDLEGLEDGQDFTDKARQLDAMSISQYLAQFRKTTPEWVLRLLDIAYTTEFGTPASQQSALNFLMMIGTDTTSDFQMYGLSDEAFRIRGGSSRLVQAMSEFLTGKAGIQLGTKLAALRRQGAQMVCTLEHEGRRREEVYDRVILSLPFTLLREVEGIDTLGLTPLKLQAIKELNYGRNAKMMYSTANRIWRIGSTYPVASNGSFFTDLSVQNLWETSRGQKGEKGIITNFLGAGAAVPEGFSKQTALADLERIIPGFADTTRDQATAQMFWASYAWSKGSYSAPGPGQVTGLVPHCGTKELDGALIFAGEHTSLLSQGYMNGAVESGNRAAEEALL